MLFTAPEFVFLFLPVAVAGFFALARGVGREFAILWLVACSLFFYGWWNPAYLALIIVSILLNYSFGVALARGQKKSARRGLLIAGVSGNLLILGYYKYANFFVDNVNRAFGSDFHLDIIILPLAVSFFTFQQIAYLADSYQRQTREHNFLHYCLFVSFFPQLIAGPIVHHKEMMPQFEAASTFSPRQENLVIGLLIFLIGLTKKVVLADGIAPYANMVFGAAEQGQVITFFEAWMGSLAYTFQLYFDFSGYSDMAIGAARIFGIRLPVNFFSPYRANNIIEFWRRWHMTLSRFLRDYVYFPLGGNRSGDVRRHANLMTTMLLGGLWHGAGWTFVAWGGLHGAFLVINHLWRLFREKILSHDLERASLKGAIAGRSITFLAVVIGWVFFRAESFDGAWTILIGMAGQSGIVAPRMWDSEIGAVLASGGMSYAWLPLLDTIQPVLWLFVLACIALLLPNSIQIMERLEGRLDRENIHSRNRQNIYIGATFYLAVIIVFLNMSRTVSEFLYFDF